MSEATTILTVPGLVCHRDEDVEKLLGGLEGSSILFRAEADELMNQLKHHPNCYKYRYKQVVSLELQTRRCLSFFTEILNECDHQELMLLHVGL